MEDSLKPSEQWNLPVVDLPVAFDGAKALNPPSTTQATTTLKDVVVEHTYRAGGGRVSSIALIIPSTWPGQPSMFIELSIQLQPI